MTDVYALAALWLSLALVATLLSIWLRVATAMSEIVVGTVAQLIIGAAFGAHFLGTDEGWIKFLSSIGAVLLTFLAGVELDPEQLRRNWKEASVMGLVGFTAPFLGCAAAAYWLLHWSVQASWLTGVALSVWRNSITISSTCHKLVPWARARSQASWITGPSAIGSENGTPSSITSAPPFTSACISATVCCGCGSPAVMYGTSALRPLALKASKTVFIRLIFTLTTRCLRAWRW